MANLVHGADGRWSACDRRGIDAHRLAASAVYEAHLRAGLTPRSACAGPPGPGDPPKMVGVGPAAAGRVLEPERGHPPPHARARGPFWPRRTCRLGGDPPRQGAGCPVCRPGGASGDGGPTQSVTTSSWSQADPGATAPCSTSTASRGCLPHPARWGAPPRCRGGLWRRRPRTAPTPRRSTGSWRNGCPPGPPGWPNRSTSVVRSCRRTTCCARSGPRPVDPDDHEVWLGAARTVDAYREGGVSRRVGAVRSGHSVAEPGLPAGGPPR